MRVSAAMPSNTWFHSQPCPRHDFAAMPKAFWHKTPSSASCSFSCSLFGVVFERDTKQETTSRTSAAEEAWEWRGALRFAAPCLRATDIRPNPRFYTPSRTCCVVLDGSWALVLRQCNRLFGVRCCFRFVAERRRGALIINRQLCMGSVRRVQVIWFPAQKIDVVGASRTAQWRQSCAKGERCIRATRDDGTGRAAQSAPRYENRACFWNAGRSTPELG